MGKYVVSFTHYHYPFNTELQSWLFEMTIKTFAVIMHILTISKYFPNDSTLFIDICKSDNNAIDTLYRGRGIVGSTHQTFRLKPL